MLTGGIIFVLGLIFGSFLNAWEYRLESKKSLGGRSFCPKCKKTIVWYDNIPVISWVILRGKCRKCHKSISVQYPLIELLTGIAFLFIWSFSSEGIAINNIFLSITNNQYTNLPELLLGKAGFQFPIKAALSLLLLYTTFYILFLVALYDAKTKYVLTKHTYIAIALGVATTLLRTSEVLNWGNLYPYLLAIFVPAGIFWSISRLTKEKAMGAGDADIALAVGALLGWPLILPAYYFSFISGALYGIWILATRKGKLRSEVPLGPFLVAGCFFAFIYGQQLINWYTKLVFGI